MNPAFFEWLNLAFRWIHVFAAILWVGQTYYFTWLDGQFARREREGKSEEPVWMVHSGGFYVVEKKKELGVPTDALRWFRWEAMTTWVSGVILLIGVYYTGGLMVDSSVADISVARAVIICVVVVLAGWTVYDGLWISAVGKSPMAGLVVSFALMVAVAYGLCHTMSGRAAYMHVGATLGTIMFLNVWMRILPAQKKMIRALKDGKTPDWSLAARAKMRSKHNTFLAIPVVFIMISNHFPTATYGTSYNWEILLALIAVGMIAAKIVRDA
jgi:uncharacterized membrane protein